MCEIILEWLSKSLIIIVRSIESVLATLQTLASKNCKKGDDRLVAPPSKYLSKCSFLRTLTHYI